MLTALSLNSFGYRFFFLLHIIAVIVAFAPAFVWPFIAARRRRHPVVSGAPGAATASAASEAEGPVPVAQVLSPIVHGGSIVLAGLFGIILVALSSHAWKFSQTWVSIGFLLWFLMIAVMFALLAPVEHKISHAARSDLPRERRNVLEQRLSMYYGALHLLLLLQLIDMIWKPGLH